MKHAMLRVAILAGLLIGLPLGGVWLAGKPLDPYLEFPPRTRYVAHEPFSWSVSLAFAIAILGTVGPFIYRILSFASRHTSDVPRFTLHASRAAHFPWWGWAGIGWTGIAWFLAWTRFPWMEPMQPFTFTPLWLGYLLVVNAWTFARTGRCVMLNQPRFLLALFPLSSLFWWFFEYLNRFVQNWFYLSVNEFTPWEYFLHASLPFSTVLPAVLSTKELLRSWPGLSAGLTAWSPLTVSAPRPIGWGLLALSGTALAGIGIWPNVLFPMVWVAPLLVITALQVVWDEPTIFSHVQYGDWRSIWLSSLAALVCGIFWEMWNFGSLAHWEYTVPYVHRFEIFQMPLLGYAGYLPFGLECQAVVGFAVLTLGRRAPADRKKPKNCPC